MSRFLHCKECHGVAMVLYGDEDAGCGQYDKLHVNTSDGAVEKHLPVVKAEKDRVVARVGEIDHPMEDDHFITWVYLETTRGGQLRVLKPGDEPVATFCLTDGEEAISVYEYCNKHGLWRVEIK